MLGVEEVMDGALVDVEVGGDGIGVVEHFVARRLVVDADGAVAEGWLQVQAGEDAAPRGPPDAGANGATGEAGLQVLGWIVAEQGGPLFGR